LNRLQQETAASWAKVRYVDKLPDPTIGGNVFGHSVETAAGSQRANLTVMQMIPWLERLDAQAQQSTYEALAMQQMYESAALRVIGELRVNWSKLYVLDRQLKTLEANRELLKSLSDLVTARLQQNRGSAGDVTLLTVEIGRVEEQIITTSQQIQSLQSQMNRLAGRPAETPIRIPERLNVELPAWAHESLRQLANEHQPALAAAELRVAATRWGLEVARLKRRPELSVGASWIAIDDNRPASPIVDVGQDAWSVGAQVSIPLWSGKYDAIEDEATRKHYASHASTEDLRLQIDAELRDLWEQAKAASEAIEIYRHTVLPQARQTYQSDLQSLANGTVDLDRVIRDVQSLLTLELAQDRALGQLAAAVARIQQVVGSDLSVSQSELPPAPGFVD
jgi:cobalt-zinc-cadmium efflux system outer membrane protein